MPFLYGLIAVGVIATILYFTNETARTFLQAIWRRWFKRSHVNALADAITVGGLALLADPDLMIVIGDVFKDYPMVVPVLGIALRAIRRFNDPEMRVFGKDE